MYLLQDTEAWLQYVHADDVAKFLQELNLITEATIEHWFTYHPAKGDQSVRYGEVNAASKDMCRLILRVCPPGDDRDTALRTLRRLRMDINLTIACEDAP